MTVAVQVSPETEQQCGSTAVSDTPLSADSLKASRGVSQSPATRLFEYVSAAWNYRKGEHCTYKYTSNPTTGYFCASVTVRLPNRDPVAVTDSEYRFNRTQAQNVVAQKAMDAIMGIPSTEIPLSIHEGHNRRLTKPRRVGGVDKFIDEAPVCNPCSTPEMATAEFHQHQEMHAAGYYPEYPVAEYVMTPGPYPPVYYPEAYPQLMYYDPYGYEQMAPQESWPYYYCPPQAYMPAYGYCMQPPLPPHPPTTAEEQSIDNRNIVPSEQN